MTDSKEAMRNMKNRIAQLFRASEKFRGHPGRPEGTLVVKSKYKGEET
jgi:hypothetical protein